MQNGRTVQKSVRIEEISEYEDIPLGRLNHELNTENKSQSVKDIVSRKMPMAQTLRRQRYHGRPHRKLMLTTQE